MTNDTNPSATGQGSLNHYGELLDISDVMEILGIGKNSAYSLLRSGEIKGFRLTRKWKIPKQSLIDFINSQNP
jgi:hypothetical protein